MLEQVARTGMSVCRSVQLCDLPERQGVCETGNNCIVLSTCWHSNVFFQPYIFPTAWPAWTGSSHDSSLIWSEIRTQLPFFFFKFYISCAGTEYRLIHVDILIHKLAWNKNEHTVHTPTLENTTIQEGTESEIGIQKNVLKTCAFPPRLIKHPWF